MPQTRVDCVRVPHPFAGRHQVLLPVLPLDLHVLSLPLAFILSQDQTLHCKWIVDLTNQKMNNKILNWLVVIVIVNYACYAYRSKHLTCCTDIHQYRLLINFCFPIYQRTYSTLSLNTCKVYGLEPFAAPLFATPFINFRRTFCYFFNPLIFNRDAKVDNHFQTAKSFLKIFFTHRFFQSLF